MTDDARSLVRWRRWYARRLRSLDALTQDDIIASWLLRVRPNVWSLAWDPTPLDRSRWPGLYAAGADGWWGPAGLAAEQPADIGFLGGSFPRSIGSGRSGFASPFPAHWPLSCQAQSLQPTICSGQARARRPPVWRSYEIPGHAGMRRLG
ncbi:MAG: hypothetical protein IVW53_12465 [Chloroflexi bacterium]|nr:hypothetical protein [Chloroflexota bacterium]